MEASRRTSRWTRRRAAATAVLIAALVVGCKSVQLEVYRRPHHDFSAYGEIAVLCLSPPGREAADRENAQEVTALIGARLIKEKYDVIDPAVVASRLRKADLEADGSSDEATLTKAAGVLGVKAILTGELEYYGPYDFHVPPSRVPYDFYDGGGFDWYGDWYGYRRRGYYYEPGYTETGSRAEIKLKLFDADLGAYVWWAEGDRSGSERIAQRYAKMVIDKTLEKFPIKPESKKKHAARKKD